MILSVSGIFKARFLASRGDQHVAEKFLGLWLFCNINLRLMKAKCCN